MVLLAALSIYLYLKHQTLPSGTNARGFGPFPNRNQTGDLFGISAVLVLGCMQDEFRRGHKRWILWLLGFGVLIAALILAFSRAGILILVVGFAAWLIRFAFANGRARVWRLPPRRSSCSLPACSFSAAKHRALSSSSGERRHSVTSDYRWLIFRDAWAMIKSAPWCGLGLGNFEGVFALFRHASRGATRPLHPESDWLWLWAEMGWPALLLILVAAVIFVRRAFPLKEGTNQRLRYTAWSGRFFLRCTVLSMSRLTVSLPFSLALFSSGYRRPADYLQTEPLVACCFPHRRADPCGGERDLVSELALAAAALRDASEWKAPVNPSASPIAAIVSVTRSLWPTKPWSGPRSIGSFIFSAPFLASASANRSRGRWLIFAGPVSWSRAPTRCHTKKAGPGSAGNPRSPSPPGVKRFQREGAKEANIYPRMLTDASNYDAKVHQALREFAGIVLA
jgi:hypothetical protein